MTDTLEEAVQAAMAQAMYEAPDDMILLDMRKGMARAAIDTTLTWMEENVSLEMTSAGTKAMTAQFGFNMEFIDGTEIRVGFTAMIAALRKGLETSDG